MAKEAQITIRVADIPAVKQRIAELEGALRQCVGVLTMIETHPSAYAPPHVSTALAAARALLPEREE